MTICHQTQHVLDIILTDMAVIVGYLIIEYKAQFFESFIIGGASQGVDFLVLQIDFIREIILQLATHDINDNDLGLVDLPAQIIAARLQLSGGNHPCFHAHIEFRHGLVCQIRVVVMNQERQVGGPGRCRQEKKREQQ